MNKFEEYNASEITPQHTLLKKFQKLLDYLKLNPTYNVYKTSDDFDETQQAYFLENVELHSNLLKKGDAIVFDNTYLGFVESVGDTTFTILSAVLFKGAKGDQGEKGDTGEITSADNLLEFLEGSDTIIVDLSEDNEHIEFHLDADILAKIENSLQLPQQAPITEKIVAIGTNGSQKLIDKPNGLYLHKVTFDVYSGQFSMHIYFYSQKNTSFTINDILNNDVKIKPSIVFQNESYIGSFFVCEKFKLVLNQDGFTLFLDGYENASNFDEGGPFYWTTATQNVLLCESNENPANFFEDTIITVA